MAAYLGYTLQMKTPAPHEREEKRGYIQTLKLGLNRLVAGIIGLPLV